jgi:hypothetical protein
MSSLLFQGQLFSVLMVPLVTQCSIFQTTPALLAKPYEVQSQVSIDSFRIFLNAIGGIAPSITADNHKELWLLSSEFNFTALASKLADWMVAHPPQDATATPFAELSKLQASAVLQCNETVAHLLDVIDELNQKLKRIKMTTKLFPPSVKKGGRFDVPDGIIAHLTRECGGNVHDCDVVKVTSGSFKTETLGANRHSGAYHNHPSCEGRNAVDLDIGSVFASAFRMDDISATRNNWLCYDFKERRVIPTHYTIRTWDGAAGHSHLKSWAVETSEDGENWREVAREEDNVELNGPWLIHTFVVAGGTECRFIRLVNIGSNHRGNDCLYLSAWEIFGALIE